MNVRPPSSSSGSGGENKNKNKQEQGLRQAPQDLPRNEAHRTPPESGKTKPHESVSQNRELTRVYNFCGTPWILGRKLVSTQGVSAHS
jgi:hypothetical protein